MSTPMQVSSEVNENKMASFLAVVSKRFAQNVAGMPETKEKKARKGEENGGI